MKKIILSLTVLSLLMVLGGFSVYAQDASQAGSSSSSTASQTEAPKAKKATHHHHAATENLTAKYAKGVQDVSGTLSMVDSGQKVVVVTDSNGVPFNFKVTRGTKIQVNGKKGTLDDLSGQTNQQVSVKFRDHLDHGLVAQSIEIGG